MVLNGREYNLKNVKNKEKLEIRRNTSFVFQNYNLFVNKTVLSNVTLGLTVGRHMKKEEAEKTGKELLDKVGLAGKYDYYPAQLSGGMQQRVGIARAMAANPEVILFDDVRTRSGAGGRGVKCHETVRKTGSHNDCGNT